jgi:hypothetical protein
MEDVLGGLSEAGDPQRPLVCLDETPKQLIIETRAPIPVALPKSLRVPHRQDGNVAHGREPGARLVDLQRRRGENHLARVRL